VAKETTLSGTNKKASPKPWTTPTTMIVEAATSGVQPVDCQND
jgi:hypothetical protein